MSITLTGQNHIRIPAYGQRTGRKNIIHSYDKERPGQRRGYPFLAPVVEELKQLTRLSKKRVALQSLQFAGRQISRKEKFTE